MNELEINGRYLLNEDGISFGWAGFMISGTFNGQILEIEATLPELCYFILDFNGETSRVSIPKGRSNTVLIQSGISDKNTYSLKLCHEVKKEVVLHSINNISSFNIINSTRPKIEFIGDSLTVGYGNRSLGLDWDRKDSYQYYTDNSLGFSGLTAKHFNAYHSITAFSGKGLTKNYNNDEPGITVPYYYDYLYPYKESPKWEHSNFEPDVTIINLGTNDFSNTIDMGEWKIAYRNFANYIKEIHPVTKLVLVSPNSIARDTIIDLAKELGCSYYGYDVNYSSLDSHPNIDEHKEIAEGLIEVLEPLIKES